MNRHTKPPFNFVSLSDFLRLNFFEENLIKNLKNASFNEEAFFSRTHTLIDLPHIIKLAYASPNFKTICKKEHHLPRWHGLYCWLGTLLSCSKDNPVTFYPHAQADSFDLLCAAYFFYLSQEVKKSLNQPFSASEYHLLKEAIKLKSVHAIQYYNMYVFANLATGKLGDAKHTKSLLMKTITHTKSILKLYGSYAYMLLAEAFYHYALWEKTANNLTAYHQSLHAAAKACDYAQIYLEKSNYSIHNASFGQGLKLSNSFGISCPKQAKQMLQAMPTMDENKQVLA